MGGAAGVWIGSMSSGAGFIGASAVEGAVGVGSVVSKGCGRGGSGDGVGDVGVDVDGDGDDVSDVV